SIGAFGSVREFGCATDERRADGTSDNPAAHRFFSRKSFWQAMPEAVRLHIWPDQFECPQRRFTPDRPPRDNGTRLIATGSSSSFASRLRHSRTLSTLCCGPV